MGANVRGQHQVEAGAQIRIGGTEAGGAAGAYWRILQRIERLTERFRRMVKPHIMTTLVCTDVGDHVCATLLEVDVPVARSGGEIGDIDDRAANDGTAQRGGSGDRPVDADYLESRSRDLDGINEEQWQLVTRLR